MRASLSAPSQPDRPHGGGRPGLAELRRELARPSELPENCRRRLESLALRLGELQGLDKTYTRVRLSEYATAAMDRGLMTV